ncbi:hypothetical protein IWX91DRAFT_338296 [Phyllosticta citricarpa]
MTIINPARLFQYFSTFSFWLDLSSATTYASCTSRAVTRKVYWLLLTTNQLMLNCCTSSIGQFRLSHVIPARSHTIL